MNSTVDLLIALQKGIAAGHVPAMPAGKSEELYWHPTMPGFGLRLYRNGSGTWILQYRNKRGLQSRYKLGDGASLTFKDATKAATIVFGEIAAGKDPQAEVNAAREKPKRTLGAVAKLFLEDGTGSKGKKLGRNTMRLYRSVFKNYVGGLARMQMDEIGRKDISEKIISLERTVSGHVANQTKSFISSVYRWGAHRGIIDVPNPVTGTFKADVGESCARVLSFDELGAIVRACEDILASSELRYKGNAWGGGVPTPANSVRADDTLLTRKEAARATGIHHSILWRAYLDGELKAQGMRRDLGIEDHPTKIKQGYHRRTLLFRWKDVQDWVSSRLGHMRSPAAEHAAVVLLLLLIGGRYSEMAALRRSEIDLDKRTLHIKGKETEDRRGTKNRRDLKLPLPQMAVDIVLQFPQRPGRDLIFGGGPRGLANNSRLKDNLDAHIAELNGGKPIAEWRHHDLRHSIATHMNEQGIDSRIVETIVNHTGGFGIGEQRIGGHKAGIAGRYNHAEYRDPVTLALDWWARKIRAVADGAVEQPDSNVVAFKGIA